MLNDLPGRRRSTPLLARSARQSPTRTAVGAGRPEPEKGAHDHDSSSGKLNAARPPAPALWQAPGPSCPLCTPHEAIAREMKNLFTPDSSSHEVLYESGLRTIDRPLPGCQGSYLHSAEHSPPRNAARF